MSWLFPHAISDASRDRTAGFTRSSTTALVGRKNYEGFAGYWPSVADDESADLRDRTFSRWFTSVQKVVFSTSITEGSLPNTTVTSDPPAQVIAELRDQPGGDIIVLASSSVIRQLLEADAVDRLSIMLCPETSGEPPGTPDTGARIGISGTIDNQAFGRTVQSVASLSSPLPWCAADRRARWAHTPTVGALRRRCGSRPGRA
jgi:dihydrofolate reductase